MPLTVPEDGHRGSLVGLLICLAVLLTPIFGLGDLMQRLSGSGSGGLVAGTKYVKDAVFVLLSLRCMTLLWTRTRVPRQIAVYVIILCLLAAVSVVHVFEHGRVFLLGFRTFLPFVVLLYGYYYLGARDIAWLVKSVRIVYILLFLSLVAEYIFSSSWGEGVLGLNRRASGFFFTPGPAGAFVIFADFFTSRYGDRRGIPPLVTILMLLMINSAAAFAVGLIYLCLVRLNLPTVLALSLVIAPVLLLLVLFVYPQLSGRGDFLTSVTTRFELAGKALAEGGLLGVAPGYGSNFFATLYGDRMDLPAWNDSLYASLFWQYGAAPVVMLLGVAGWHAGASVLMRRPDPGFITRTILLSLVIFAGLGLQLNEMFPLNLLIPLFMGYTMKGEEYPPAVRQLEAGA
jgi:hypothetical protein